MTIPQHLLDKWKAQFWPSIRLELWCYFAAPFVAMFIRYEVRTDRVKIRDNKQVTMMREYLYDGLMGYQTHDNAVDEWWYGGYYLKHWLTKNWTQEQYNTSKVKRWFCRWAWMWRNNAYGFLYKRYGIPKETAAIFTEQIGVEDSGEQWKYTQVYANYFQVQEQAVFSFLGSKYVISKNWGWKPHKMIPNVLYANRVWKFPKKIKQQ